ncbi:hypothetical protein LTR85_004661 [Meristemomyces frigidus]|nr:hypothetical protein LTR85_004661 [Meristemomyces frigidus]
MSLNGLPPELVERIAQLLDPMALGNLRLTAREVYDKTFHDYSRRVLGQRWLLTREESMRTLMDVACDPRFRNKLTELRIDTHTLLEYWDEDASDDEDDDDEDDNHRNDDDKRSKEKPAREEAWRHFIVLHREQDLFMEYLRPTAMLTLALTKLPALRNVEVGEWCRSGQFPRYGWGGNRVANLTQQSLCPYEWNTGPPDYYETNGHERRWDDYDYEPESSLAFHFSALLTALSVTRTPIERLSAGLWKVYGRLERLRDLDIPSLQQLLKDGPLVNGLKAAFTDLKSLRLALEYQMMLRDRTTSAVDHHSLANFLNRTPRLEALDLYFDDFSVSIGQIHGPLAFGLCSKYCRLEHLTSLDLHNLGLVAKELIAFRQRHASTLQHVSLERIALYADPTPGATGDLHWSQTLNALQKPSLRSLTLQCLYEDTKLIVFDPAGLLDCSVCGTCSYHRSRRLVPLDCSHVPYTSNEGLIPTEILEWNIVELRPDDPSPREDSESDGTGTGSVEEDGGDWSDAEDSEQSESSAGTLTEVDLEPEDLVYEQPLGRSMSEDGVRL